MNITASFSNNAWNSFNWLLAGLALALAPPARAETPPAAIPFPDIGARATAGYEGDALGVIATADGARLRCRFQKLEGHATAEGLWLESTKPGVAGKLRLTASALCRDSSRARECALTEPDVLQLIAPTDVGGYTALATSGNVSVNGNLVRFTRPGLTEEYSVSVDGVRQDFIIESPPLNPPLSTLHPQPSTLNHSAGDLRVELALSGARAQATAFGARLAFEGSGRVLAYRRLRVEDATGRELTARLEVLSADRLAVSVADANATYPLRIDPTFTDADWVSLGSGMGGPVNALAVSGANLYAGGYFTTAGGVTVNNIAKWNGSVWSALGSGIPNGNIYALVVSGTNLYAGGYFTAAGGVSATNIAQWNGSGWSALGLGMNGEVRALAVSGTTLYAGGTFTKAGGASVNYVAQWNGSSWSHLGGGMNASVKALAVVGTDLYAGGSFTSAGGVFANCIAKSDGSTWSALVPGTWVQVPAGCVNALAVSGTDLYAGGDSTVFNYSPATGVDVTGNVAKWNGSAWSSLGTVSSGNAASVYALAVIGTDLFAGGSFDAPANYIAKWDGRAWSSLGSGLNSDVYALAADGAAHLFVGGGFTYAGTSASPCIALADATNALTKAPPVIVVSPASLAVPVGATADFQVVATGSPLPVYQWVFNGTNAIAGATSAMLNLANVQFTQAGAYSVTVSNLYGAVTSAPAILTVTGVPPVIVASPVGLAVPVGATADFQVEANGSPPLLYQWVFNGATAIAGATSSVLSLKNVQFAQAGAYSVTVSNLYGAVTSAPALLRFFAPGIVVTNCTEGALRAAMSRGGTVTFACDGAITLASTISNSVDTLLDGSGHQVTISGGGTVRIFCVTSNVSFTLMNLTVAQGSSDTMGAGILNSGGTVNAIGVAFAANSVSSSGTNGAGGAIRNELGTLNLQACSFTGNSVIGSGTFTNSGGAIYNNGTMTASACTFTDNQARNVGPSGQDWMAGGGAGGAVYNAGVAVLEGSTFSGNTAVGAEGWVPGYLAPAINGGTGSGGAICNLGRLTIQTSSLLANSAEGGKGSDAPPTLFDYPGWGANGGSGLGGALDNEGTATVASSTFADNSARGGPGGAGADGTDHYVGSTGGRGGAGGWATGAVHNRGSIGFVNCTFASNSAFAGAGGNGGKGGAYPGDGYIGGSGGAGGPGGSASGCLYGRAGVTNCTAASNSGQSGSGGQGGAGGAGTVGPGPVGAAGLDGTATGGFLNVGGQLVNTLLAWNTPESGDSFPDPKLGPLTLNGGPTLTMALLPGSPAIDAGNTSLAPPTDQRGFPRPAGLAADLGAFEYGSMMPTLTISPSGANGLNILASGNANQPCRLLLSMDMSSWVPIATNQMGSNGRVQFHDTWAPGPACRFYRLVMP